jgi:hypothetical protein
MRYTLHGEDEGEDEAWHVTGPAARCLAAAAQPSTLRSALARSPRRPQLTRPTRLTSPVSCGLRATSCQPRAASPALELASPSSS